MRNILLLTLLLLISTTTFGQFVWKLTFDTPDYIDRITYDTASNPNCLWQVGSPSKTVFTSANSIPNAIVTDTLNPVPSNDTSTFYLVHLRDNFAPFHVFVLNFMYRMDGDSTDFGTIEISPDNGLNWVNMLTEDSIYQFSWWGPKPSLRGATSGWESFQVNMDNWASSLGPFPIPMTADTIRFRFTYITDGDSTAHDGWMIDDFLFEDWWEGVERGRNDDLISVFPNPARERLALEALKGNVLESVQIINCQGQVVFESRETDCSRIDVRALSNGVYFLKAVGNAGVSMKRFLVEH